MTLACKQAVAIRYSNFGFFSFETNMILKIPNETFLRITQCQIFIFLLSNLQVFLHFSFTSMETLFKRHSIVYTKSAFPISGSFAYLSIYVYKFVCGVFGEAQNKAKLRLLLDQNISSEDDLLFGWLWRFLSKSLRTRLCSV